MNTGSKEQAPQVPPAPIKPQKDKGYDQSHGYGPGHGGPSGPGDAPATTPATVVPTPEEDDRDDE